MLTWAIGSMELLNTVDNKPFSEPMLAYFEFNPKEKNFCEIFNQNTNIFIQETLFENVHKTVIILFRSYCVK